MLYNIFINIFNFRKAAELAPIIIEKTLGSAKQKTKDKGTQLLLLIMEIDVPDAVVVRSICKCKISLDFQYRQQIR